MTISDLTRQTADRLIARYPQPRSALLPLLYLIQSEHGYITDDGLSFCAEKLGLTRAEVQAVQSFYEMYEREPVGDWLFTICTNFSCEVRGAKQVYEHLKELNGGSFNRDHGIAVKHVECLGNCEDAPVVQINYQNYRRCSVDDAEGLFEACRAGEPPASVSGETPPTFREVSWWLSGATDHGVLHAAAVEGARADVARDTYEKPPAQRIFDQHKDIGAAGVRDPGPDDGEPGDLDSDEPIAPTPPAAADLGPDRYPGTRRGAWGQ